MSTNEWFTPEKFIRAAREVLGTIDLDPASCEFANRIVQATQYYTKADNGLLHAWEADSVFLNPPYGKTTQGAGSNLEHFTRKLVEEYECGNTKQAILLIPVNTATSWFPMLWDYPICFPKRRIRFYTLHGLSDGASFPTCFVYLGPNEQRFIGVFSKFGRIGKGIDTPIKRPSSVELWHMMEAAG